MTPLRPELERILPPERILDRPIDVAAYASDASFYRLVPRAVLRPESVDEVREIFALSHRLRIPMTFRAAGTSLSGQAITDGLLVDVGHGWRGIEPLDGGKRVRVQPGAIGGKVNRTLAAFGTRIGPDPASIDACMMGGILSNNSSGMCCGVAQNSYHTLDSLVFVLPSGTVVDTSRPGAAARLRARRTWPRRRPDRAARRRAAAAGAGRAHPEEVPDQEHHRLLAERVPRLRHAARDAPAPADRIRGDAGVPRRGRAAHRPRPAGQVHRPAVLPPHRGRGRSGRAADEGGRRGDRADGSGRAPVGAGDAGRTATARDARTRRGRDPRRVPVAGRHAARHRCAPPRTRCRRRWSWSRRPSSPAIRRSRRGCGRCARACSRPLARCASAAPA